MNGSSPRTGTERIVLDNTYVTRASRSDVIRIASAHRARVRCVHYETPLAEAQINVVLRMIERFGRVVPPEEIAELARVDPAALAPHALSRMTRDLEPPTLDEGFAEIEAVRFVRDHSAGGCSGVAIAADTLGGLGSGEVDALLDAISAAAPCVLYAWKPSEDAAWRARIEAIAEKLRANGRAVEIAICPHPAGPPICWCRPPLPALFLAFATRHRVDLRASTLFGRSPTDRRIASVLGISFVEVGR